MVSSKTYEFSGDHAGEDSDCCFRRCYKTQRTCCGRPCYAFKSRMDSVTSCLLITMIAALIFAVTAPMLLDAYVNDAIYSEVIIDSPSSSSYQTWRTNTEGDGLETEVSYKIYLFDYQNVNELLNGSKPVVVQKGPYYFREFFEHIDIEFIDGGDAVSYRTYRYYIFDEEKSAPGHTLSDKITLPYVAALGLEFIFRGLPIEANYLVDAAIQYVLDPIEQGLIDQLNDPKTPAKDKPEIRRQLAAINYLEAALIDFVNSAPPGNGLFKMLICLTPLGDRAVPGTYVTPFWSVDPVTAYFGWLNDPILKTIESILIKANQSTAHWTTSVPGVAANLTSIEETRRRRTPDTIKTGKRNIKETNQYVRFRNQTTQWVCLLPLDSPQVPYYVEGELFPACADFQYEWTPEEAEAAGYIEAYNTPYANRIQGTDASRFGYPVTSDKLAVYISDIYRSLFLGYAETVRDWYDVPLRRYILQEKELLNSTVYPPNWQWDQNCPNGMANLSFMGVPSYASLPHFLLSDESLLAAVEGLAPEYDAHQTFVDVEPNTGLTTRAYLRLQLNYYMADNYLPSINDTTVDVAANICASYSNGTSYSCVMWNYFFQCLNLPSNWKYYKGGVYMPYTWVEESVVMDEDTASGIKDLNDLKIFKKDLETWSFVVGGVLLAICMGLVWGRFMYQREASGADSALTYSLLPNSADAHGPPADTLNLLPHATGGYTSNALHGKQGGGLSNTLIYDDEPGVVNTLSSGSMKL